MSILGIIPPAECDEHGVPLDWERCRVCNVDSDGTPIYPPGQGGDGCPTCDGHGSLKAAALAELARFVWADGSIYDPKIPGYRPMMDSDRKPRCTGCGHPMSEGTWERHHGESQWSEPVGTEEWALAHLRYGAEPPTIILSTPVDTHYSPCDKGCHHSGAGRTLWTPDGAHWVARADVAEFATDGPIRVEASWRPVDVRTLSWPHDLRREMLAVLCLRCWATRP